MRLSATDRAFLRGQFPGLRTQSDAQIDRWFFANQVAGNPALTLDESIDQ